MQIIKACRGRITGHFGDKNVPGANVPSHLGMDQGHGDSTDDDLRIVAPADGIVTAAGPYGTYGNRIIIDHGGGWTSLLAHNARILVTVGSKVTRGDLRRPEDGIAVMGSTGGNWAVHCHQELRYNGVPVDPEKYLTTTSSAAPAAEGDDDMQLTDKIATTGAGAQPLDKVLDTVFTLGGDTNTTVRQILAGVQDLQQVKHNGIDAPSDVVEADTRIIVGNLSADVAHLSEAVALLGTAVASIAAKLEVTA